MIRRSSLLKFVSAVLAVVVAGCARPGATLNIIDVTPAGSPARYRQVFEEAYFDFDANRTANIVLLSRSADLRDPDSTIRQTVHIRSVWESVPGDTIAEKTQINATIRYVLQSGGLVGFYEGGGSLIFDASDSGDELEGTIELARLRPAQRGIGHAQPGTGGEAIFQLPIVEGKFRAVRNRRRVARVVNEVDRLHRTSTSGARTALEAR